MTFGNLAALGQHSLQRLLAYSSIAQAGYLLTGLCAGSISGTSAELGASAMLLYLVAYLFMNLGIFAVVSAVSAASIGGDLLDYRGLGRRAPALGVAAAFFLFSLVGLPPFAGFFGKWALISALLADGGQRAASGAGDLGQVIALAIVLNSVLSLAYYARILRVMFFEAPVVDARIPLASFGRGRVAVLTLCAAGTLLFCVIAGPLELIIRQATLALFVR
jgi:NADH-quinone oxidoreductase subunit N